MQKPILHKRIFWDVNFDKIDYQEKAAFVIERVFEWGDVEDIRQVRKYYGDLKVKQVLMNCRYLPEIKIYLAAAVFNERPEHFKCYIQTQSMKDLWPF
jgi:phage pi2 protein 07